MEHTLRERIADHCLPDSWQYFSPRLAALHIERDADAGVVADWLTAATPHALRDARALLMKMSARHWRIEAPARERCVLTFNGGERWQLHLRPLPQWHVDHVERLDAAKKPNAGVTP